MRFVLIVIFIWFSLLSIQGGEPSIDVISKELSWESTDPRRVNALKTLEARSDVIEAAPQIVPLLLSSNAEVSNLAEKVVLSMGAKSIPYFVQFLSNDPPTPERDDFIGVNGPAGEIRKESTDLPKDASALIGLLQRSENVEVQKTILSRLRRLKAGAKDAVPLLCEMIPKSKGALLSMVLSVLGAIGPDAKPALPQIVALMKGETSALDTSNNNLSIEAAHALVSIDNTGPDVLNAAKMFVRIVQTERTSWDRYGSAVESLKRIGDRAVPILIEAYKQVKR